MPSRMKNKDLLVLLLPSALFLALAVAGLVAAGAVSLTPKDRDTRRKLDDVLHKVQIGELHPTQDTLLQLVRDSRDLQDEGRQTVTKFLRAFGLVSLCGAGLQAYLILRLRARTAPNAGTNQTLHSTPR
jgi:hypothetical protein